MAPRTWEFLEHNEGGDFMTSKSKVRAYFLSTVAPAVIGAASLVTTGPALAAPPCQGPGAPTTTETKCLTAVAIPGNPLRSFDISFVNEDRNEYYLAERTNAGIVVIDTKNNTFVRIIKTGTVTPACSDPPGTCKFVGILPGPTNVAVNNNISGPDGVTSHSRWLYAGDGNSTVKVIDLNITGSNAIVQSVSTGGSTRVDEMALTTDGKLLLAANNAEDPPFATLFNANGDNPPPSNLTKITKITVDNAIIPSGKGLSIEQPAWDPTTKRFYVSVPQIANNPTGCTFDGSGGQPFCQGGLLIIDPATIGHPTAVVGAFNAATNTGVFPLNECGPNGATVGPHDNLLLGCTPQNVPTNTSTLVINAKTKFFANIGNITGSDEVWFNAGDDRYYLGASRACGKAAGCPAPLNTRDWGGAALGVINAETNLFIEKIPQGQNSHSVAADCKRNTIFDPQVAPNTVVGVGGDSTDVGAGICGTNNGCVAVYVHKVKGHDDDGDKACKIKNNDDR
jgi:hypothetical protein